MFQSYHDHAKDSEKHTLRRLQDLIILLSEQVHSSHRQAENAFTDFKTYIIAIEISYKNVDGDFEKTVAQPAEKEAQERDREEEKRDKVIEEFNKRDTPKFYE